MILADFEPGILFLLLWGLLSWFGNKMKKKTKIDSDTVVNKPKPKEDLFARLKKLQDNLSQEFEIFPSKLESNEIEEKYLQDDAEFDFEEPEIILPESEVFEPEDSFIEFDLPIQQPAQHGWLKDALHQKSELRRLMILKEVLGEPRSLNPYTGNYFRY